MPLRSKFCIPFSLQLWKVEVINTYHVKFYIEIPTGRPVILNVKFSFVLPPLLDSKNGREPLRELDLVALRGIWCHTRTTTWPAFEWPISLKEAIFVAQGPSLQRPRIVNTGKKTHGDFLDIYGSELCSKGGNFFRQIVLYVAPKHKSWLKTSSDLDDFEGNSNARTCHAMQNCLEAYFSRVKRGTKRSD